MKSSHERSGFIWYSDKQIFTWSDAEIDAEAKRYRDLGYTVLITFSGTHFRWTFHKWWDDINAYLTRFCAACHKYGLKVVEHHSCHLNFVSFNDEDLAEIRRRITMRGLDLDKWQGIDGIVSNDQIIDGVSLWSMCAVSGATGKPERSGYLAYPMCFNNPDFRRIYFNYLESLYRTGLDGIMTDDVQYMVANTCACEHCRKLFKEETGYELPDTEHWSGFYANFDDRRYVAWRRFRQRSTDRFQRDVNKHFESLGYNMLRPNYVCGYTLTNPSAYTFDNNKDLWTLIFQENFINSIIKQSWLGFGREAVHRTSLASRTGVDSLSLFYPQTDDMMYFSWALSHLWGQLLLTTFLGNADMTDMERPYRTFDADHAELYEKPVKVEDLAVWFSSLTRDCTEGAMNNYMKPFGHIVESAMLSGYNCGLVFEWDTAEELKKHPVIIIASAAMVTDDALGRLREYARNGGRLIVLGEFAVFDENGTRRDMAVIRRFIGETGAMWRREYQSALIQPGAVCNRKNLDTPPPVPAPENTVEEMRKTGGKVLRGTVSKHAASSDPDILPGLYRSEYGYTLNLFNMAGTISAEGEMIDHKVPASNFMPGAEGVKQFTVTLDIGKINSAVLYTPEHDKAIVLEVKSSGYRSEVVIPDGAFAGYAVVKIR